MKLNLQFTQLRIPDECVDSKVGASLISQQICRLFKIKELIFWQQNLAQEVGALEPWIKDLEIYFIYKQLAKVINLSFILTTFQELNENVS